MVLHGVARVKGPSALEMPAISIGMFALSLFWSAEMSEGSPYLLSLGLSKSAMAMVFLAGPLSGLIMQPLVGVLSDNCRSSWGRRAPFIFTGTILCILSMLLLGYTRSVSSLFSGRESESNDKLTIFLGVFAIYCMDFSINIVQAVDRALIVDTLPISRQPTGNAWAARMMGTGSVVGFFIAGADLTDSFKFLGSTQLQKISVIVSFFMLLAHALMVASVQERVLRSPKIKGAVKTLVQEFKELISNILSLPPTIRQICMIQFFAWLGWFPILFYTTTYIGELYKMSLPDDNLTVRANALSPEEVDAVATRLGSRALFYSSVLALLGNIFLPLCIKDRDRSRDKRASPHGSHWSDRFQLPEKLKLDMATLWAVSHALFSICMITTFFFESVFSATTVITITGLSWAVTQWAPFSLLAGAILNESDPLADDNASILLTDTRMHLRSSEDEERQRFLSVVDADDDDDDIEQPLTSNGHSIMGNAAASLSGVDVNGFANHEDEVLGHEASASGLSSKAGIILGIHNIFLVIPQFLVTGIASLIFAIYDPPANGKEGSTISGDTSSQTTLSPKPTNTIVYVFRLGGLTSAVAFFLCWRLTRQLERR